MWVICMCKRLCTFWPSLICSLPSKWVWYVVQLCNIIGKSSSFSVTQRAIRINSEKDNSIYKEKISKSLINISLIMVELACTLIKGTRLVRKYLKYELPRHNSINLNCVFISPCLKNEYGPPCGLIWVHANFGHAYFMAKLLDVKSGLNSDIDKYFMSAPPLHESKDPVDNRLIQFQVSNSSSYSCKWGWQPNPVPSTKFNRNECMVIAIEAAFWYWNL